MILMPGSERFIMRNKISWSLFPIPVALKRVGTGLSTSFGAPSLIPGLGYIKNRDLHRDWDKGDY